MKTTRGRSFTDLKNEMEEGKFRAFCKMVTEDYVTSNWDCPKLYFIRKYNIAVTCFYKILDTVVIENIVDEDTVSKMEEKAIERQRTHDIRAGASVKRHYNLLKCQRMEYIQISQYSSDEVKQLATEFAYSPLSKKEFARSKNLTVRMLDLLIERAIVQVEIDDIIFSAIKKRSIERATSPEKAEKSKKFFSNLTKKRNSNKKRLFSI